MRVRILVTLALPAVLFGLLALVVLSPPATAARPEKLPPQIVQEGMVSLEKNASSETVALGQVVSFTVTIKNDGSETVNPTLTDTMPDGLALQSKTISATTGLAEAQGDTVSWMGSLAPGEEAVITYDVIPPSTSGPGETWSNVAKLEIGGANLEAGATVLTEAPERGIWRKFINLLAVILVSLDRRLKSVGIPYSFGFAIILFTVIVRVATFPLNMQQIKSSKAMQELQPKMKEMQEKYKGDREKLAQEQMKLYKEHGVNPLGGCLPMLVQMPI